MRLKMKNTLIGVWGIIWYISTAMGIDYIVENIFHVNNGGFRTIIGGIFTTGSFIGLTYMIINENKGEEK